MHNVYTCNVYHMLTICPLLVRISFNKLKDLDDTERRRQDELDLKTLRILRAIVHNRIVYIDPDLQENDPAGYRSHCVAWLHPVQNKLQGFGNIVSRVRRPQLFRQKQLQTEGVG